ncbi:MAG: anthranilate synthase component I family protein [Nanoarchaeota archaeon]|nr:anthranilate synthase component I family protein [Nanoarchaeota archaeon]
MTHIINQQREAMQYENPFEFYSNHSKNGDSASLLLESRTKNLAYGRQSIIVPNVALRIEGKNEKFRLTAQSETGEAILSLFEKEDFGYAANVKKSAHCIEGEVPKGDIRNLTEAKRIRQPNASYVIRTVLDKFKGLEDSHLGLYGAFAFDFARYFENFGDIFSGHGEPDFLLFMPSTVIYFDDIKETGEIKKVFFNGKNDGLEKNLEKSSFKPLPLQRFEDMSLGEYESKVVYLIDEIRKGRMMQCVLSRTEGLSLQKHPLESYKALRNINPSPYSFYFSFGENQYLYGASPEVHIKVDKGNIEIRPIAGTARRSTNALEDAMARIGLQTNQKELREHTMLVDLARSELYRICDAESVFVSDMFTIESYPNLYHLASGVRGKLRKGIDSLDALLTTIPAGTLSGAPKVEAMKAIEQLENSRRGFYGGAIGYLNFNGDCNTGIAIRSVFVNEGMSFMRAGAGVVAHSTPEGETAEIQLKSEKAMKVLE